MFYFISEGIHVHIFLELLYNILFFFLIIVIIQIN